MLPRLGPPSLKRLSVKSVRRQVTKTFRRLAEAAPWLAGIVRRALAVEVLHSFRSRIGCTIHECELLPLTDVPLTHHCHVWHKLSGHPNDNRNQIPTATAAIEQALKKLLLIAELHHAHKMMGWRLMIQDHI